MKCIWLGIKDYCKDCWHDWLFFHLKKLYKNPDCVLTYYNLYTDKFNGTVSWKEGSVWHYIKQRKLGKKTKHE